LLECLGDGDGNDILKWKFKELNEIELQKGEKKP
jgi:hypothetical protein